MLSFQQKTKIIANARPQLLSLLPQGTSKILLFYAEGPKLIHVFLKNEADEIIKITLPPDFSALNYQDIQELNQNLDNGEEIFFTYRGKQNFIPGKPEYQKHIIEIH